MIRIEERTPTKIPGLTSLYISFPFNKELIDIIAGFQPVHFNKKTYEFEVPVLLLSQILDEICVFDDIELKLLEEREQSKDVDLLVDYKIKPFDYQIDGIKFGIANERFLLLDEPGLGKTMQIIHIAEELHARGEIEHCLIICGVNTLKTNWKKEIEKHSNLSATILGEKIGKRGGYSIGSVKERVDHLKRKIDEFFIITNVETIRNDDIVTAILKGSNKIDMIVVDEVHCCKSSQSQQGANLLKLSNPRYKIGATGTLIMNNPLDAYLPLKWIGAEHATLTNYKNYYCTFGGNFHNIIVGFKHLDSLKQQIEACSIRRLKDKINLPPKTIINEFVDMGDRQSKFYDDIVHGVLDEVDKVEISTSSLLALVSRLRQATACPSVLTSEPIESAKVERAIDLTEQITEAGKKVVIFSTFKETVRILADRLSDLNPLVCTGDTNDKTIEQNKELFQSDPSRKVFIATWQKMGTGITLTAASYAIFIDTPWTSAVYNQAQDRVHRIGTSENVTIYDLITTNTIDERVLEILNDKEAIGDFILDDTISRDAVDSLRKYILDLR